MDNHAGNSIVSDNYMTGLVDSDFGVYINRFYPRGKLQLRPEIIFVNTNFYLIETCHSYLQTNSINHHIRFRKAIVGKDKKELIIQRQSKCIEFVDKVVGYSVVRRLQLETIKKFCEDRLQYVNEFGWKQNNTPYTNYQKKLYDDIVELNLNYNYDSGHRNYTSSWLAGFIDGDGSVCFVVTKNKRIVPVVDITTGSDTAKNNVFELYDKLNIKYDVRTIKSKAKKRLGKRKKKFSYNIYIKNLGCVEEILNLLNGKLVAKQKQLELMLQYLALKKSNRLNTAEMWSIVDKVKYLNHNPNTNYSDTPETNTQDT